MTKDDFDQLYAHILANSEKPIDMTNSDKHDQTLFRTLLFLAGNTETCLDITLFSEEHGDDGHMIGSQYDPDFMKARIDVDLRLAYGVHEEHMVYLKHARLQDNALQDVMAAIEEGCMWLITRLEANQISYDKDQWVLV